jgi:hypothetical protein
MTPDKAIQIIKSKFEEVNSSIQIPLMKKNKHFTATLREDGIEVDNLNSKKLLPWIVFEETVGLLIKEINSPSSKGVRKGNAMNGKLGDVRLPKDSIEGYLAIKVYNKKEGSSVFRRITPIAGILAWTSICTNGKGYLTLK